MDNLQKGLIFLFAAVGIYIFYTIVMFKLDVMATQTKARLENTSTDMKWKDYQGIKQDAQEETEELFNQEENP